jgi:hypothetical protein
MNTIPNLHRTTAGASCDGTTRSRLSFWIPPNFRLTSVLLGCYGYIEEFAAFYVTLRAKIGFSRTAPLTDDAMDALPLFVNGVDFPVSVHGFRNPLDALNDATFNCLHTLPFDMTVGQDNILTIDLLTPNVISGLFAHIGVAQK